MQETHVFLISLEDESILQGLIMLLTCHSPVEVHLRDQEPSRLTSCSCGILRPSKAQYVVGAFSSSSLVNGGEHNLAEILFIDLVSMCGTRAVGTLVTAPLPTHAPISLSFVDRSDPPKGSTCLLEYPGFGDNLENEGVISTDAYHALTRRTDRAAGLPSSTCAIGPDVRQIFSGTPSSPDRPVR
jgi:hypothetical protein